MNNKCIHCKENIKYSNTLCNKCRFDKNIMKTTTELKKLYKCHDNDIDDKKIYNESYKTSYGSYGT
jgi:hypothetical protein